MSSCAQVQFRNGKKLEWNESFKLKREQREGERRREKADFLFFGDIVLSDDVSIKNQK